MTSEEIRTWRESKGWTIKQLAEALGAPYATVYNWENGRNSPSGSAAARLEKLMKSGNTLDIPLGPEEIEAARKIAERKGFKNAEEWAADFLRRMLVLVGMIGLAKMTLGLSAGCDDENWYRLARVLRRRDSGDFVEADLA